MLLTIGWITIYVQCQIPYPFSMYHTHRYFYRSINLGNLKFFSFIFSDPSNVKSLSLSLYFIYNPFVDGILGLIISNPTIAFRCSYFVYLSVCDWWRLNEVAIGGLEVPHAGQFVNIYPVLVTHSITAYLVRDNNVRGLIPFTI